MNSVNLFVEVCDKDSGNTLDILELFVPAGAYLHSHIPPELRPYVKDEVITGDHHTGVLVVEVPSNDGDHTYAPQQTRAIPTKHYHEAEMFAVSAEEVEISFSPNLAPVGANDMSDQPIVKSITYFRGQDVKSLSKNQLIDAIAESAQLAKGNVRSVIEHMATVGYKELNESGEFVIPGFVKMSVVNKPATEAHSGVNPFTREPMEFAAKPASKSVKASPLKAAKDAV